VHELLVIDDTLRDAIVAGKSVGEIRRLADGNLIALRHDGFRKVREGITTIEEVVQVVGDFVEQLDRKG
jgi:type IV pilus assembly protein PilB